MFVPYEKFKNLYRCPGAFERNCEKKQFDVSGKKSRNRPKQCRKFATKIICALSLSQLTLHGQ